MELVDSYEKWQAKRKDTTFMKNDPNAAAPEVNWEKALNSDETAPSAAAGSSPAPAAAASAAPKKVDEKKPEEKKEEKKEADAVASWSQDEQKALEAAMKKYPASLGQERWCISVLYYSYSLSHFSFRPGPRSRLTFPGAARRNAWSASSTSPPSSSRPRSNSPLPTLAHSNNSNFDVSLSHSLL